MTKITTVRNDKDFIFEFHGKVNIEFTEDMIIVTAQSLIKGIKVMHSFYFKDVKSIKVS